MLWCKSNPFPNYLLHNSAQRYKKIPAYASIWGIKCIFSSFFYDFIVFLPGFLQRQQYGVYTRREINMQKHVWMLAYKQIFVWLDTGRKPVLPRFPLYPQKRKALHMRVNVLNKRKTMRKDVNIHL